MPVFGIGEDIAVFTSWVRVLFVMRQTDLMEKCRIESDAISGS
jgi:hypothetical protein